MSAQQYRTIMAPRFVPGVGVMSFPMVVPVDSDGWGSRDDGSNSARIERLHSRPAPEAAEHEGVETSSLLADPVAPTTADPAAVSPSEGRGIQQYSRPRSRSVKATKTSLQGTARADGGEVGAKVGEDGLDLAGGNRTDDGRLVGGSVGAKDGRIRGGAVAGRTHEVDEAGEVVSGEQFGATLTGDALHVSANATRDSKTFGVGAKFGEDGADIEASYAGASASIGGQQGDFRLSGGFEGKTGGGNGSFSSKDGMSAGATDDAWLSDAIGESRYVSRTAGQEMSAGGSVKSGAFSAGASVSSSDVSTASFHSANAGDTVRSPWEKDPLADRLSGVDDYSDVDLAALEAGEAYAFDHKQGDGVSGSLGVGPVSGSIGTSDAHSSRTTLARDEAGDLRVNLSTGASTTDSMGVSAMGLAGASASDSKARGESASFTATGEAGETAVRGWQETGLLPGVAGVAWELDPKAAQAWMDAQRTWSALQGDDSPTGVTRAALAQKQMRSAAAPLNQAFLRSRSEKGLGAGDTAGVTWDEHTTMRQTRSGNEAELLGMSLGSEGVTDTFWDSQYREGGKEHEELGFQRDDDYRSSPTEESQVAVDGKRGVALAMRAEWEAWSESHDSLAALGPDAFGLPPELVEAWRTGELDGGKNTRLMLQLGEDDLTRLEALIGEGDADSDAQWGQMAGDVTKMRDFMRKGDGTLKLPDQERIRRLITDAVISRRSDEFPEEFRNISAAEHETNAVCKHLATVNTPDEFAALNLAEKRLMMGTAVIAAAQRKSNPWEALRLVMSLKPGPERNELLRELFVQIESNRRGSNAAIEFVQFVQAESKEVGADPRSILGAVRVETIDGAKELREETAAKAAPDDPADATRAWATTLRAAVGEPVKATYDAGKANAFDGFMGESQGKRVTDWMQIIVEKAGPKGLEAAIRAALHTNPRFLNMLDDRLGDDDMRRKLVRHLLQGTAYSRAI